MLCAVFRGIVQDWQAGIKDYIFAGLTSTYVLVMLVHTRIGGLCHLFSENKDWRELLLVSEQAEHRRVKNA